MRAIGTGFTVIAITLFVTMLIATAGNAGVETTHAQAAPTPQPAVPAASPSELAALIGAGKWTIVEFGGEHCIPCRAMQPVLQELRDGFGARVVIRNFWIQEYPEVARAHTIMVMPTQVVFNPKGEEVLRHMGVFPVEEFRAALAEKGLR